MHELNKNQFLSITHFLPDIRCDISYAYSIVEGQQRGRIFVDNPINPQTVLIWHYSGLSVITGKCDNDEFNYGLKKLLQGIYEKEQRKFLLWVNDEDWIQTIASLITDDITVEIKERLRFRFNQKLFNEKAIIIPEGYKLKLFNDELIRRIEGNIVPNYSWDSPEAFLAGGIGYCLLEGENIACNSFSSAIGNGLMDIGIETMANYRHKGLAIVTAAAMVSYCLANGYEPCWGCNAENIGSKRVAENVGFEVIDSHAMYVSPQIKA